MVLDRSGPGFVRVLFAEGDVNTSKLREAYVDLCRQRAILDEAIGALKELIRQQESASSAQPDSSGPAKGGS